MFCLSFVIKILANIFKSKSPVHRFRQWPITKHSIILNESTLEQCWVAKVRDMNLGRDEIAQHLIPRFNELHSLTDKHVLILPLRIFGPFNSFFIVYL